MLRHERLERLLITTTATRAVRVSDTMSVEFVDGLVGGAAPLVEGDVSLTTAHVILRAFWPHDRAWATASARL